MAQWRGWTAVIWVAMLVQSAGCSYVMTTTEATDPDLVICGKYGYMHRTVAFKGVAEKYGDEIRRRGLLTDTEWQAVSRTGIFIGMSTCGMYASIGRPNYENRTVTSRSERIQHVYRGIYDVHGRYVYTENGRVTSWQD